MASCSWHGSFQRFILTVIRYAGCRCYAVFRAPSSGMLDQWLGYDDRERQLFAYFKARMTCAVLERCFVVAPLPTAADQRLEWMMTLILNRPGGWRRLDAIRFFNDAIVPGR